MLILPVILADLNTIMDRAGFLFYLVLLLCVPRVSFALHKNITTDQSALLALKSHIASDPNSKVFFRNWTTETSVCNWIGVECSARHNRVVALNISYLGLQGTISPQIGNLSFLNSIDIRNNNFQGELPEEIVNLSRLRYVNLNVNNFVGEVPGWLGFLPNLQYLNLGNNSFSGSLPGSLFNATKLQALSLSSNNLNGYVPQEVGNLGNLRVLDMQYNQFTGSIPLSVFNISSLQFVAFTDNGLSGNLPLNICSKIPRLSGLYVSKNKLSGQIHSRFDNCSELQNLSLSINDFTGPIPPEIGNLTMLVELYLGQNKFEGEIPPEFGNLFNLELLNIGETYLFGPIPSEIGNLHRLSELVLYSNFLSGPIPESIFNISSLSIISLLMNNLTGSLPLNIGQQLPNLEQLVLGANQLSGVVPSSILNFTRLTYLILAENQFSGSIPSSLGNLRFLKDFSVFRNFFTSDSSSEFGFLESLTNCRNLMELNIAQNPLNIPLLPTIGNFSSSLNKFYANSAGIRGNIPHEIGNLTGLLALSLGNNNLIGLLPPTIQKLSNLQVLELEGDQIAGFIPNFLCNLRPLAMLYLGNNKFFGHLPDCFGNMTSLRYLYLDSNGLNSTLPAGLFGLRDLLVLDVHSNSFSGEITPTIGDLNAALSIDLSENEFSGNIPPSIGGLGNLINLSLAHNKLEGPIPETFWNMISLESLDLSHNNLTGEIPTSLGTLLQLKYFNVSFNHLSGRIPTNGSFLNFSSGSFMSNDALCGGAPDLHFPPCAVDSPRGSRTKRLRILAYILIPVALVILVCSILLVFLKKWKKNGSVAQVDLALPTMHERFSYYELQQATNGFNESNLLGMGSYGSVYKGLFRDGIILAIKVFNLQLEGSFKSFETECEVISNIRHRNLVKVISSCSNLDFKALVLEYMPNGSLEKWLYSHNYFLDFLQRLNIMIDVASALDYLHNGYTSPIVHCDLKPSNVLLDGQMIGHVSDFGISKLFGGGESMMQTTTLATIGYIAPEYGSEGKVSTSCDVYSFGVLLMETFSRKRPTDDILAEGRGLREWIMDGLQSSTTHFIDHNLLTPEGQNSKIKMQCILSIMELALKCTVNSPERRTEARVALAELQKTKLLFLSS